MFIFNQVKVLTYGVLLRTLLMCHLFSSLLYFEFTFLGPNLHSIMYCTYRLVRGLMSVLHHLIPAHMSIRKYRMNKVTEPWILTSIPVWLGMRELTHL